MTDNLQTFAVVALAVFVAMFIGNTATTAFTEMNAARLEVTQ